MIAWRLIRWGLVISAVGMTLMIGVLDYPRDLALWDAVVSSTSGWWHEQCLIFLGYIVLLDLTYHWEKRPVKVVFSRSRGSSDLNEKPG